MKNEGVSMFKLIQGKLGIKSICYVSYPHATIKLHFCVTGDPCNQENHSYFFEVCKPDMLCENIYSVAGYDSAVMEFWPVRQRIKLILISPSGFDGE